MTESQSKSPVFMYFFLDLLTLTLEFIVYFVSLYVPFLLVWQFHEASLPVLLAILILAFLLAVVLFGFTLVVIQRVFIGKILPGRYMFGSLRTYPWLFANRFNNIMLRSPFKSFIYDIFFFRYLYLVGIGAQVKPDLILAQGVVLGEPYMVKFGNNVIIGEQSIISAHKIEHNVLTIEMVEIGDNVLVGARSIILPGVKIGSGAIIGANSLLTRGTVVPPGETWMGSPARKFNMFELNSKLPQQP